MSVTGHEIPLAPSSAPPDAPEPEHFRPLAPDDVPEFVVEQEPTAPIELKAGSTDQVADRPPVGAIVAEVGEEGTYVVRDLLGAVYGAGATPQEARAEFEAALDDHLRSLRERYDELHPRLQAQLALLEKLFPGR